MSQKGRAIFPMVTQQGRNTDADCLMVNSVCCSHRLVRDAVALSAHGL